MAFIQKHERVGGHVVGQGGRRLARCGGTQVAGVVFNAFAVPHFAEHFQIEARALLQPLGLHQLTHAHQFFQATGQFFLDGFHRCQHLLTGGDVVAAGVHREARNLLADAPRERVEQHQRLHLVVEQLDAHRQLRVLSRKHVDGVAAHAEFAARKLHVVALVLHAHQLGDHVALAKLVAHAQRHHHLVVALGLANAIDGRNSGDDDNVCALQQAFGTAQPHLLDVLIDGAVFFNEQIALRHVGLGLVVVVVADEILHRVFRKKLAELAVQLRRQRLVGRKHDGRAAHAGDHVGHREGFARAGHAQQGLEHLAIVQTLYQLCNGRGLVTRRWVGHEQFEGRTVKSDKFATGRLDRGHQGKMGRSGRHVLGMFRK